jgi:hypothetical protein
MGHAVGLRPPYRLEARGSGGAMGRKRRERLEGTRDVKVSLMVPAATYRRLGEACEREGLTLSALVRRVIEEATLTWPAAAGAGPGPADDLTVRLHPDQRSGLRRVADAWGMAPHALVQLLLAEQLPAYLERAARLRDRLLGTDAPPSPAESSPGAPPAPAEGGPEA